MFTFIPETIVRQLTWLFSSYGRWEEGLANQVQYDADGNLKTEIIKTPFVQVCCMDFLFKK